MTRMKKWAIKICEYCGDEYSGHGTGERFCSRDCYLKSEFTKRQWADPSFRQSQTERIRQGTKTLWKKPSYKKAQLEKMRRGRETPEYRKGISVRSSKRMKCRWQDPQWRTKMLAVIRSSDNIAKRVKARRKKWDLDPDFRKHWLASVHTLEKDESRRQAMLRVWADGGNHTFRYRSRLGKSGFRDDLQQFFRSTWEANFARVMNFLDKDWQFEPQSFKLSNGQIYRPDFRLDLRLWVEIKGWLTQDRIQKPLQFCNDYPEERLIIIGPKQYNRLTEIFQPLIPNWEV